MPEKQGGIWIQLYLCPSLSKSSQFFLLIEILMRISMVCCDYKVEEQFWFFFLTEIMWGNNIKGSLDKDIAKTHQRIKMAFILCIETICFRDIWNEREVENSTQEQNIQKSFTVLHINLDRRKPNKLNFLNSL